ncbi:MAG: DNA-3-methyladenine glycosylase [Chloroflexi bacterium]|nr:DNA-3-methyladenine glycosylase [Chloroflexota bacterium]
MTILPREFYIQYTTHVARELLGMTLVRSIDGQRVAGMIVETEAYTGRDDLASHGHGGKTPRNLPMWGPPGHAYVYLVYGMHWLLNIACEPEDYPAAVLIRALEPLEGLDIMQANRAPHPQLQWTKGPARLTKAMQVDGSHNRIDMTNMTGGLWVEAGQRIMDNEIHTGPRIGMGRRVHEPWFSMPWRWWIAGNRHVSR